MCCYWAFFHSFTPGFFAPHSTCSFVPWPKESKRKKIGLKGKHAASKGRRGSCDHRHEGSSGVISLASVVESDSVLIIVKAGSHLHPMPQ